MEKRNISVDISEAYRYMGGIGAPDGSMRSELRGAADLFEKSAISRAVVKLCEIERGDFLSLKGTCLKLRGKSIEALLNDCPLCVIFCATVGNDIEACFDAIWTGITRWYISVALFLKLPSAGVTRYPYPMEPGLSSRTGFRLMPAVVRLTR